MGSEAGAAPQGEESQDADEIKASYKLFIRATEQYIANMENENATLKAQIHAAAREDAIQKETVLELQDENKKLKESHQELQAQNQRLREALAARRQQTHLPLHPGFAEARVNTWDQSQEQLQGENKVWELTQMVVSQLTRMTYAIGLRGTLGYATWTHDATDFSFSLELCPPPYGPAEGVRGGKVIRYRPHSLGTLREVAPSWMRNQLLLDIQDLPLLIKRLIWVAEKRIL